MPKDRLEGDKVVVTKNPEYSDRANEIIADEMREAVGAPRVEMREPDAGEKLRHRRSDTTAVFFNNRILLGITGFMLVAVAAFVGVGLTESWWYLPFAVGVALLGFVIFTMLFAQTTTEVEKPDPTKVVELEEEGVLDPEGELNERVAALDSDHANATEDQSGQWTPASGGNPDITPKEEVDAAQQTPAARAEKRLGRRPSE
jgi:hypothetical protein